jgi:hypothetical protein
MRYVQIKEAEMRQRQEEEVIRAEARANTSHVTPASKRMLEQRQNMLIAHWYRTLVTTNRYSGGAAAGRQAYATPPECGGEVAEQLVGAVLGELQSGRKAQQQVDLDDFRCACERKFHQLASDGRTWWDSICRVRRDSLAKAVDHTYHHSHAAAGNMDSMHDVRNTSAHSTEPNRSRHLSAAFEHQANETIRGSNTSMLNDSREQMTNANSSIFDHLHVQNTATPRSSGERMYREAAQREKDREAWVREQRARQVAQELRACTFSPNRPVS